MKHSTTVFALLLISIVSQAQPITSDEYIIDASQRQQPNRAAFQSQVVLRPEAQTTMIRVNKELYGGEKLKTLLPLLHDRTRFRSMKIIRDKNEVLAITGNDTIQTVIDISATRKQQRRLRKEFRLAGGSH